MFGSNTTCVTRVCNTCIGIPQEADYILTLFTCGGHQNTQLKARSYINQFSCKKNLANSQNRTHCLRLCITAFKK